MAKELLVLFLSATLIAQVFPQELTRVINTPQGPVQGTVQQTFRNKLTYYAFQNIPYAEPPVGERRFQAPQPMQPWNTTRSATSSANICAQTNVIEVDGKHYGNEDCLRYSVNTAQIELEKHRALLPVLVQMRAHAYYGDVDNAIYSPPDHFMEEDIIVVEANYRVGILGFLCMDDEAISCNNGFKDQNLLMEVIRNNIASYGGDPNRITVVGESIGGSSITDCKDAATTNVQPLQAVGMVSKPVAPWQTQTVQQSEFQALKLSEALGYPAVTKAEAIDVLMNAPVEQLLQSDSELPFVEKFRPVIADPSKTASFLTANKVPVMLGSSNLQSLLFTRAPNLLLRQLNEAAIYAPLPEPINSIHKRLLENPNEVLEESAVNSLSKFLFESVTDQAQRYMSQLYSSVPDVPIYYYRLDVPAESALNSWLYNETLLNDTEQTDDAGVQYPTDPNDPFNVVTKLYACLLANFVKTGNPTPPGNNCTNVTWEDSKLTGNQFNISLTPSMIPRHVDVETLAYEALLPTPDPVYLGCETSTVTVEPIL